jgi:hypothetical protein
MSVDVVVASSSEARDVRDGDLARFVEDEPWMNCGDVEGGEVVEGGPRGPNA